MTPHLEELYLEGCYRLQEVHAPMGCLNNLTYLNLSGCSRFQYFLVDKHHALKATLELIAESLDVCPLHPNSNLPKFQFKCNYGEPLCSWSGNVEKLISFGVCACTNLESFSASICGLQYLKELTLKGSIPEVPKDLWRLESLEEINFWMIETKHLPDSICMLKHLKSLKLRYCQFLEQLPQDLGRLEFLEELDLKDCISLRDIPHSICNMRCLKELDLRFCILVEKLPEELGYLKCLKVLDIQGAGIIRLPESIYQLKGLCIIGFRRQLESYGFTYFPKTSGYFDSYHVEL
ncbi:putative leucine-rich repeat domain superfamily [Helianthus anomalus]